MSSRELETILVVCADAGKSAEILQRLHEGGASAIGPVSTAGMALALAAQTGPRSAILAGELTGRRDATALARELSDTWGVDCYVLPSADCPAEAQAVVADERRAPRLRDLLRDTAVRPAARH
ncbi:MAG: hypothetical protein KKE02_19855 [Alphaproteobacteria bacterium]|nr:hypothetical protein [Alphaproteobacteria bacterium]MBU1516644.1 hypothetical protein [Alphaproteobacteria bacterium]MBU2094400.1 hypothetical protein [Alphaproteobacteria bacterium]MBU2153285.1 hypothetical protein [Alphaproteobacteria bacterium]MBU2307571.1 hypothetical protein [Alphaproteobacteria bacterium]